MGSFTLEEYTVGWISALDIEMAAARSMLDVCHGTPPIQNARDANSYILGSIGDHNIVLACLSGYGTTSAATAATSMLFSFPSVRFGLMVGIGGGIPSKTRDIRLGDVVVSTPENNYGGVVQYDFGKKLKEGHFKHTGTLSRPPLVLLNGVSSLRAEYELGNGKIPQYVREAMLRKNTAGQLNKQYSNPGPENDKLYNADYDHIGDEPTCESCDVTKVMDRPSRPVSHPIVHYGTIASGNQVIKDAKTRDEWGVKFGAICFEMEAAGLMDNFPCLVVRGICDYADSHKNKDWQRYAAAVAAAYAKE
jgi:nucleoside phosphorylase